MKPAFKLSEITAMQLNCIKQCNEIIAQYPGKDIEQQCKDEITKRKHWAMHPSEVQI